MTKYNIPDDHWNVDEKDAPPAWWEDTSAHIDIDVTLHREGYQEDRKWTVHCADRTTDEKWDGSPVRAMYAIEHQNKGNYWREGDYDDAVDFVDLPLRCRKRVAAVLNRDLETITPDARLTDDA
jgi:hypothetical protein